MRKFTLSAEKCNSHGMLMYDPTKVFGCSLKKLRKLDSLLWDNKEDPLSSRVFLKTVSSAKRLPSLKYLQLGLLKERRVGNDILSEAPGDLLLPFLLTLQRYPALENLKLLFHSRQDFSHLFQEEEEQDLAKKLKFFPWEILLWMDCLV